MWHVGRAGDGRAPRRARWPQLFLLQRGMPRTRVAVGNQALFAVLGVEPGGLPQRADELRREGQGVMLIAVDGRAAGLVAVADPIKESAIGATLPRQLTRAMLCSKRNSRERSGTTVALALMRLLARSLILLLSLALANGNAHAALRLTAAPSEPCPEEHAHHTGKTSPHHQHPHGKGLVCCCLIA